MTPRILVIAGSDSGGGAGIQADIRTITMLGGHACTAITAVTAQNTLGVSGVHPIPTDMVLAQIGAVADDIGVDAVKIGMIGSAETAHAVADWLERGPRGPVIFDPVMAATSGSVLADDAAIAAFGRLMRLATLTTPNAPELAALGGDPHRLAAETGSAVLAKGGDRPGDVIEDVLVLPDGTERRWADPRIETRGSHGTGCTLASAIAVGLARALPLDLAISGARGFVRAALRDAPGLGAGHGPMGHHHVRLDLALDERPMLNQITLPASDYLASVVFYRLLGARRIVDAPPRYARFELSGGTTLSIEVRDPPAPPSTTEFFWQCCDLDAEVARLRAAGVAVSEPERLSYLWRVAELRDPHGNPLRLYDPGENRRFPPWRVE